MKRVWQLLGYMRPYTAYWLLSIILMATVGAMTAFRTLLVKPIFENVLSGNLAPDIVLLFSVPNTHIVINLQRFIPRHFHNAWVVVAIALVGSAIIKSISDYLGTLLANKAGFGMITDLRNDLYDSVLRRSTAFFQRHTTGSLLSTLINDIERVQMALSSVMSDFLQQLFTMIFLIGAVVLLGGKLAWILLVFLLVIVLSAKRIGRDVRKTTRRGQDKLAEIQNILHETITGNGIVKAFGMERWEMTRFRRAADRLLHANMRSVKVQSISSPLMDLLGAIAIALILDLGRGRIVRGQMTAGSFVAFIIATFSLYDPVRKMAGFYNSFQQAIGASDEIFRFMDAQDEVVERKRAIALKSFEKTIEFSDVHFSYDSDGEPKEVLHGVSLTVARGEVVALVGPSGAGKSTLMNLLPRFFDVTGGAIFLDGHDVRDLTLVSLREQIGKVTQETVLFNDTVRNNIAYGQPDVPMERIEAAARAALAHDFILNMPDGYDTMIGERGTRLSGGERQRLAIARALLKDAPILVLDEATSSLDAESEAAVQAALANLMQGRTVLVIAHRLSTVRRADRIAVMEHGAITELGSHDELVANSGTYQRLYNLQFGDADMVPDVDGTILVVAVEGIA
jgi:ATP-binding cassette, subfamily B, bacterial MsbA